MKIRVEVHCTAMDDDFERLEGCVVECAQADLPALEDAVDVFMEQVRAELPVG